MVILDEKKGLVEKFIKKGILVSPDFLDSINLDREDTTQKIQKTEELTPKSLLVLTKDASELIDKGILDANWPELERLKVLAEKNGKSKPYETLLDCLLNTEFDSKVTTKNNCSKTDLEILFSYDKVQEKKTIDNFVSYFNQRYKELEKILSVRQELSGLTAINRVINKKDKENISVIGMVVEKNITSNNNIILKVEDRTGEISVLINKNKPELFEIGKDIVEDEVIGIVGVSGDNIIFCNNIVLPDIPLGREVKKSPNEEYAVFLSDIHIGSDTFMEKEFNKFLDWLNGNVGNEKQKKITEKIKYLFIVGDLIDGVGIYPGQEDELIIKDIYKQYDECAKYLSRIPSHIQIVICPGNHESTRLSEPQPPLLNEFAKVLSKVPNVTMVSNPSVVRFGKTEDFPGFDVLLYHGYCFDYYIAHVDTIRNNGGYDRADLVMKFLLQRRHLAPTHKSTLYVPDKEFDPLVIKHVPDFFVSGHIHKVAVSSYRGVSLICGSCWQSMTSFQKKMGHHPEPARVPLVNLQTRDTKILRF